MTFKAKMGEFLSDVKSITKIPAFTLSPAKAASTKSESTEPKKDEKMKTKILEAWNNIRYDLGSVNSNLKKDCPIWILGICHHARSSSENTREGFSEDELSDTESDTVHAQSAVMDFASRPWFTYRKQFPPIKGTNLTTDTGWGCMLRSVQMMIAQGFLLHYLGREWRWLHEQHPHDKHLHRVVMGWFIDDPSEMCPLSVHHLSEIGRKFGNVPGNWYGPSTVAYIAQEAVERAKEFVPTMREVAIYVAQDCTVYSDDVYDLCCWGERDHHCLEHEEKVDGSAKDSQHVSEEALHNTSSASSEDWEEDDPISSESSSFVIPVISLEESIPTRKIMNNSIQMTEFSISSGSRESSKRTEKHDKQMRFKNREIFSSEKLEPTLVSSGVHVNISNDESLRTRRRIPDAALANTNKNIARSTEAVGFFEAQLSSADLESHLQPDKGISSTNNICSHFKDSETPSCHDDQKSEDSKLPLVGNINEESVQLNSDSPPVVGRASNESPPQSTAVLVFIPVRLGESSLNPMYIPCIQTMLSLKYSIGIIGGKPKHSLFFVGYQDESLLHLDPHYCQVADTATGYKKNLHNYHTMSIRKTSMKKIDPSCCFGFYCRNKEEFESFKRESKNLFPSPKYQQSYPMCLIVDGRSDDHHVDIDTLPENISCNDRITTTDQTPRGDIVTCENVGGLAIKDNGASARQKTDENVEDSITGSKDSLTEETGSSKLNKLLPNPSMFYPKFMKQISSPRRRRRKRLSTASLEREFELL